MSKSSNSVVVPAARAALDRFKMEAASEVGVTLKAGDNGDLTSRQAGSIGGQMVNVMCPVRQMVFTRTNWRKSKQSERITYVYALAV